MFIDINDKVGAIATDIGKTPMGWNSDVIAFIKSINDNVIIPIAGLIITAVLCIELINMVIQKNNMHDTDTFESFKYIIKMWIAVWLVSNAFTFSMAVFDVAQNLVNQAADSGNFLTETYLSIRRLENEIIKMKIDINFKKDDSNQIRLVDSIEGLENPIRVSIGQFSGIEINDFAVTFAKTALWIAESQMMDETA